MGDTQRSYALGQIARLDRHQAESDKLLTGENKLRWQELEFRGEETKLRLAALKSGRQLYLPNGLAGVSFLAGLVGLVGGVITVVGLLARVGGCSG